LPLPLPLPLLFLLLLSLAARVGVRIVDWLDQTVWGDTILYILTNLLH
jgi:hypothetical protein